MTLSHHEIYSAPLLCVHFQAGYSRLIGGAVVVWGLFWVIQMWRFLKGRVEAKGGFLESSGIDENAWWIVRNDLNTFPFWRMYVWDYKMSFSLDRLRNQLLLEVKNWGKEILCLIPNAWLIFNRWMLLWIEVVLISFTHSTHQLFFFLS